MSKAAAFDFLTGVAKLSVHFNPAGEKTAAAREFLQRCFSPRVKSAAPKAVVVAVVHADATPPGIVVEYESGTKQVIWTSTLRVADILDIFSSKVRAEATGKMLTDSGRVGVLIDAHKGVGAAAASGAGGGLFVRDGSGALSRYRPPIDK